MCGRYYRRGQKQELAERFRVGLLGDFPVAPDSNIAPTTFQPVVRQNRDTRERELVLMRWGLVPFFAKSLVEFRGFSTINARAETIAGAASYREAFRRRRCLVPADGFYEWKKTGANTKQAYSFGLRSNAMFAFAGVWDAWRNHETGEWLQSFSIITTDANELAADVHDRMPVIVDEPYWDLWLDRDVGREPGDIERLLALLRPFAADRMSAAPCESPGPTRPAAAGAAKRSKPASEAAAPANGDLFAGPPDAGDANSA